MSNPAISANIRSCIKEAYVSYGLPPPKGITAHSTRSAAMSAAFSNRASLEEICKAAAWFSLSTFVRHYKINTYDSADAAFGRRVLQQVMAETGTSPPVA